MDINFNDPAKINSLSFLEKLGKTFRNLWVVIFFLSAFIGFYLGIRFQEFNNNEQPQAEVQTESVQVADNTPTNTVFDFNATPEYLPLLLSSREAQKVLNNSSIKSLSCLHDNFGKDGWDGYITFEDIAQMGEVDQKLIDGLQEINAHKHVHSIRSSTNEIVQETLATNTRYLNICHASDVYYVTYAAHLDPGARPNTSWNILSGLIQTAYAGGPAPVSPRLATIDQQGVVEYFEIPVESSEITPFTLLKNSIINTDAKNFLRYYPSKLLFKFDDKILALFETRCYECHSNHEVGLFEMSFNPLKIKQLSFCEKEYLDSGIKYNCSDSSGKYVSATSE